MLYDFSNQFGYLVPFALTPRLVQGHDVALPLLGIASLVCMCQHKYWMVSTIWEIYKQIRVAKEHKTVTYSHDFRSCELYRKGEEQTKLRQHCQSEAR